MGLNVSLMGAVGAIMAWVVRYYSLGVINVFFDVFYMPGGGDPEFDVKQNMISALQEYILDSLLLKPLNLPVLQALPESLGGGNAGVKEANAHPNREPTIFWIAISVLLLSIILIILIQVATCCCCCLKSTVSFFCFCACNLKHF